MVPFTVPYSVLGKQKEKFFVESNGGKNAIAMGGFSFFWSSLFGINKLYFGTIPAIPNLYSFVMFYYLKKFKTFLDLLCIAMFCD